MLRGFVGGFVASLVLSIAIGFCFFRPSRTVVESTPLQTSILPAAETGMASAAIPSALPSPVSSVPAASSTASVPTRSDGPFTASEWSSKEIARLAEEQYRANAELDYYPLLQELALPAAVQDKLMELVVRRRLLADDLVAMWQAKKIATLEELQALHANLTQANDASARELLGDRYARYASYTEALPIRKFAREFVQQFPRGALNAAEVAQVTDSLVASYAGSSAASLHDDYALPLFPTKVAETFRRRLDVENRAVAALAKQGDLAAKVYQPLFDRYIADLKLEMAKQQPVP